MSVLLRQPGGFEGVGSVYEPPCPYDLAVLTVTKADTVIWVGTPLPCRESRIRRSRRVVWSLVELEPLAPTLLQLGSHARAPVAANTSGRRSRNSTSSS